MRVCVCVCVCACIMCRDTHIMPFEVPIMLCSDSQHQANNVHCFVPIILSINFMILICDNSLGKLYDSFISTTHISVLRTDKLQPH